MSEKTEQYAIRRIYEGIREDSTFSSFEDFWEWAYGKYRAGHTIYKLDQAKPYSRDNSYWYYAIKRPDETVSPICKGCAESMIICNTIGCLRYREWFIKNWNDNICVKPKKAKEVENMDGFFRYEHPDLVREGIVFEHCQSIP